MNEDKMPDIIENSVAERVLPLKSTLIDMSNPTETETEKSESPDDDVKSLIGEVYAG
jgi:hypothetical protein